jgi:signal transduction histidine kinase
MTQHLNGPGTAESDLPRLLAYVTALELEVDRLRRHNHAVNLEVRAALHRIRQQCLRVGPGDADVARSDLAEVGETVCHVAAVLRDLGEVPGYHPARDQVVAVAVRPLAEQVFRSQQRLLGAPGARLDLELECEHVEWFPGRLRHILDNLLSNALRYRDAGKEEAWVRLRLRASAEAYEFRVSDNGVGMPSGVRDRLFDVLQRAAPGGPAGPGVGLAVVQLLVEQSGGTLTADSGEGQGSSFVVVLPRFGVEDFLT